MRIEAEQSGYLLVREQENDARIVYPSGYVSRRMPLLGALAHGHGYWSEPDLSEAETVRALDRVRERLDAEARARL